MSLAYNYDPYPITLVCGKGPYVYDCSGNELIDMMSAYSATSLGHCHPKIVSVLVAQANKLAVTSRAYKSSLLEEFAEEVCRVTGLDQMLPMNTGAEAVETAIKAARKWGYEVKGIPYNYAKIIVAKNNFHGRTTTICGFSSDPVNYVGYGPYDRGFISVVYNNLEIVKQVMGPDVAAVLVEPIQGEAGIIIPDPGYLKGLRELCDARGILLILDEVQSGLGRTGEWFAYNHENLKPDGVCLGKALGGGMLPVSALVGTHNLMNVFTPGTHGSTFGGNQLAAAVGLETIRVMEAEDIIAHARMLGADLLEFLKNLQGGIVKNVRGKGLWAGIELDTAAKPYCLKLLEKGVLTKDTHRNVIRIAPPLNITKDVLYKALTKIKQVLQ